MAKDTLPERINAYRLAESKAHIKGVLPVKEMLRLKDSLISDEGEAVADLDFGKDDQHISLMKGKVNTVLKLQCQRCMDVFDFGITADFISAFIKKEENIIHLPEKYDPVVTEEGEVSVKDIIEDELIISLPIVPMHDLNDCKVKSPNILLGSEFSETEEKRENPFKVIEILRTKQK